jgi:hypothetical protein
VAGSRSSRERTRPEKWTSPAKEIVNSPLESAAPEPVGVGVDPAGDVEVDPEVPVGAALPEVLVGVGAYCALLAPDVHAASKVRPANANAT